jgi:hypothetical protein
VDAALPLDCPRDADGGGKAGVTDKTAQFNLRRRIRSYRVPLHKFAGL